MDSMLATETTVATTVPTEDKRLTAPALETWAENEPMRHIPPLDWMIRKLDVELRPRIHKLATAVPSTDPRYAAIDSELRALGGAIDRMADVAKATRYTSNGSDLAGRLDAALTHAVSCLRALESTPFGKRFPFHTGERSKSEPVYSSLLAVMDRAERLLLLVRAIDPAIDERLLA
jgi:hypothetical protein